MKAPPSPRFVSINGTLMPADAAHLSVFDRGFQLGDGIFETLRARSGRPVELAEHLTRAIWDSTSAPLGDMPRAMEDEWLWGWDPTPGIVSVWALPDADSADGLLGVFYLVC